MLPAKCWKWLAVGDYSHRPGLTHKGLDLDNKPLAPRDRNLMLALEDLLNVALQHEAALHARVAAFDVGGRHFDFNNETAVMGVINLSSNSWYRESVCLNAGQAIRRGRVLHAQGADLVDIGAESSLPHAVTVTEMDQHLQLLPVLTALAKEGIATSIETYHASVARACLRAGAAVINLTGARDGVDVYRAVAEHDAAVIICFVNGRHVRDVDNVPLAGDPNQMLYDYLAREVEIATQQGVSKIFVDAGLGFYYRNLQDSGKRINFQISAFLNSFRLRSLGFPVCNALPHAFEHFGEEVRSAEVFFAVLAKLGKTDLLRTHEVARIKAVLGAMGTYAA